MRNFNIMIKPASSLCNMRCKYCFYADVSSKRDVYSYGIMKEDTLVSVLDNIKINLRSKDRVNFVFQGGEPTLAGVEFYERFFAIVSTWKDVSVTYAMQTNAYELNEHWCNLFKKFNFLVGVSFDILPDVHDDVRIDSDENGTYKKVLDSICLLKKHKIEFNVLCTLTSEIACYPDMVWEYIKKYGIDYVQFTPCLSELSESRSEYALFPERFAQFYIRIFELWRKDYRAGKYISVKFFDDIVNQIILRVPTSCGMDGICRPQFVVESDGSVYPCDFYCIDMYKLGNLSEMKMEDILGSDKIAEFVQCSDNKMLLCKECAYARFCNGNCKRMRREICVDENGNFCGYKSFLDKYGSELAGIAKELMKQYR